MTTQATLTIEALFPTPLAIFEIENFENTYVDVDSVYYDQFFTNPRQLNVLNHVSHEILLEDGFENLRSIVESGLETYIRQFLCYDEEVKLKHASSWITIGLPGSRTQQHMHTNSIYSGVLYLKSIKGSGDLYFALSETIPTFSSSTLRPKTKEITIYNATSYQREPKTGDLFIFPSHLYHGVTENISGENRCALAFNYFLEGNIATDHTNYLIL